MCQSLVNFVANCARLYALDHNTAKLRERIQYLTQAIDCVNGTSKTSTASEHEERAALSAFVIGMDHKYDTLTEDPLQYGIDSAVEYRRQLREAYYTNDLAQLRSRRFRIFVEKKEIDQKGDKKWQIG